MTEETTTGMRPIGTLASVSSAFFYADIYRPYRVQYCKEGLYSAGTAVGDQTCDEGLAPPILALAGASIGHALRIFSLRACHRYARCHRVCRRVLGRDGRDAAILRSNPASGGFVHSSCLRTVSTIGCFT